MVNATRPSCRADRLASAIARSAGDHLRGHFDGEDKDPLDGSVAVAIGW